LSPILLATDTNYYINAPFPKFETMLADANQQPHPTLIVDALLGQGEALDCYNMREQDAAALKSELDNQITQMKMDIINTVVPPENKPDAFEKVFCKCCEEPVTTP